MQESAIKESKQKKADEQKERVAYLIFMENLNNRILKMCVQNSLISDKYPNFLKAIGLYRYGICKNEIPIYLGYQNLLDQNSLRKGIT